MKFSILVPVYNVEKYIEQCVDSLLSQTYRDFEIILVDDGSTDSSGEICDRYQKENPGKVFSFHQKNSGQLASRLFAISKANGDFCLFVDSDDLVESNLLELVVDTINRNPETDMVVFNFSYFENGKKTVKKPTISEIETVYEGENKKALYETLLISTLLNSLWTKAIKKDILKYESDYSMLFSKRHAEDAFMSAEYISKAKKVVYINEPLYCYRIDNISVSRNYDIGKINQRNTLFLYQKFLEYIPEWGMENKENIERLNLRWFNEVLYTFTSFYNGVKSFKEKKAVVDFNWDSMLPADVTGDNFTIPDSEKGRLYKYIKSKNYFRIHLIFLKNNLYNFYKKIKRKNR